APEMHDHGEHADHGGHHEHDKQSGEAHCPPCVSCCAAAVISHAMTPSLPARAPLAAIPASHEHVPGVPPASLDRPPLAL
ncbi:MAG: hypothetical protein ACT4P4_22200, partial [Betaproteobacteria bacterium]